MARRGSARIRGLIEGRQGVVFDVDGTLVDTRAAHLEAWSRVTRELGIRVSRRRLEALFGKRSDFWAEAFLPGGTEKERRALVKAKDATFLQMLPSLEPFPSAIQLLRLLSRRGKKIAFATGATKAELAIHMRKLRAGRIADATVYDAEVKRGKPYPDSYLLALKRLGLKAREVAVVGDSLYDAQAARAAGIACIAVRTGGFSREALVEAGATLVFRDVGSIFKALER